MSDQPIDLGKLAYAGALAASRGWQDLLPGKTIYPHDEVEAAFQDYAARANMDDWDYWADIFSPQCLYVDHHFGVFHTAKEVASWMTPLMATQPEMRFIPEWHVVMGNLVVNYNWNRWPNPEGSAVPYGEWKNPGPAADYRYQFPCVTLNIYGGGGKFCYEEDLYSPAAYIEIRDTWRRDMGMEG